MLVLSRRENEKVLFPTLGISVEVLRIRGNTAKVGIDAPSEIPVLRHELAKKNLLEMMPDDDTTRAQLNELVHAVQNHLDSASMALNELHQNLDETQDRASQEVIMGLYRDLQSLERDANRAVEMSSNANSLNVLVVEDSATERALLASVLELSGLNVNTARDGRDALEFLSMHSDPDAILLDMKMPRCDGPTFVKEVRSDPDHEKLKIFAVSGIAPDTLGVTTGIGGIDGWFPKPLDPNELVCVLSQTLNETTAA